MSYFEADYYQTRTVIEEQQWDKTIHRHEKTVVQRWVTVDTICPYCREGMEDVRGWVVEVNFSHRSSKSDPLETHRFSCPHCNKTFYMETRAPKGQESWWY